MGLDIAHDDQDRPVGPIVELVKPPEVVEGDSREVLRPSEDGVAVRVAKVRLREVVLVEATQGGVEVERPFLDNHLAFGFHLDGVEVRPQHTVSLDRQREFPTLRRKGEPVVRVILAGFGVRLAGGDKREAINLPLRKPVGPLEEHMLDEVRQPTLAGRLVNRADGVVKVGQNHGRVASGQYQCLEAVVERPLAHGQVGDPRWMMPGGQTWGH